MFSLWRSANCEITVKFASELPNYFCFAGFHSPENDWFKHKSTTVRKSFVSQFNTKQLVERLRSPHATITLQKVTWPFHWTFWSRLLPLKNPNRFHLLLLRKSKAILSLNYLSWHVQESECYFGFELLKIPRRFENAVPLLMISVVSATCVFHQSVFEFLELWPDMGT